jgi:hypothetical protein
MTSERLIIGLYCLIFGFYWRIQLRRADRWKGVFFYALTVEFILCTVYFIITIIQDQFFITMAVLNEDSLDSAVAWMTIANNALYTSIDFISQLILLYRCWIMWRQPLIMVVPCILSLAFLVTALTTLGFQIKDVADNLPFPDWYLSAVTAFFFISLGVNALVTALIVYRIISVYNDIRGFNTGIVRASAHGNGQRDLYPLISILIESGLLTFVGQLAQSIMYKSAGDAFPLVGGCVVMLYGISSTVVLVRVELGISYDNNTTKAVNSATSGRPIQLTPFASKPNQTRSTIIDVPGSDDPYDTRSERKATN